nr:hypothetical protein CFP56_63347 [Quercus suber]
MEFVINNTTESILSTTLPGVDTAESSNASPRRSARPGEVNGLEDDLLPPSKKTKLTPKKNAGMKTSESDSPRKRRIPSKAVVAARPLARTWVEASEEDKMLITMRDENRSWADIRKEWELLTGEVVGGSTLPNRYARLKELLTVVNEEDCARMLESLTEVEKAFQKEKWNLIAESVVDKGGQKYKVWCRLSPTLLAMTLIEVLDEGCSAPSPIPQDDDGAWDGPSSRCGCAGLRR